MHSFIQSLRKGLSESNQAILDEIADHPVVHDVVEKAAASSTKARAELVKQRAAVPAKYAKRRATLASACAAAMQTEAAAEQALRAAQKARVDAWAASYGCEMAEVAEDNALQKELRRTAPAFLQAACRAAEAFSLERFTPLPLLVLGRVNAYAHPAVRAAEEAALAAAQADAALQSARVAAAVAALSETRRALHDLELEALSEADLVERVGELLASLNERLEHMTQSPRFVIDEHLDVVVAFGHGEKALKVSPSDVGAAKAH